MAGYQRERKWEAGREPEPRRMGKEPDRVKEWEEDLKRPFENAIQIYHTPRIPTQKNGGAAAGRGKTKG